MKKKVNFLADISQELRAPMTDITGLGQLLSATSLDDEQREIVEDIIKASLSLQHVLDDIQDISRIESGEQDLQKVGFDLVSLCHETIDFLKPAAECKGLGLVFGPPDGDLPFVVGDPEKIKRVLINLIGNCIKYTPAGRVSLALACEDTATDKDVSVKFTITDTGIGIAGDKICISKELVHLMNGDISVNSSLGQGAAFTVTIPLLTQLDQFECDAQNQMSHLQQRPCASQINVLIVEDSNFNQLFIAKILNKSGINFYRFSAGGDDAVRNFQTGAYDLIIMDCDASDQSGYQLAERIRSFEDKTQSYTPIIALTADTKVATDKQYLRCGMDDYINKPLNLYQFQAVLSQWVDFSKNIEQRHYAEAGSTPVDLSILENITDGCWDQTQVMIQIFLDQAQTHLATLERNCISGQNTYWAQAAHSLSASSFGVGAFGLHLLCSEAHNMQVSTGQERAEQLQKIKLAYDDVQKFLMEKIKLRANLSLGE